MSNKEGGRGLANIKNSVDVEEHTKYIKKTKQSSQKQRRQHNDQQNNSYKTEILKKKTSLRIFHVKNQ